MEFRNLASNSTQTVDTNDAAKLRNTLRVYGSIFLVLLLLFCFLRRKYPRAYNLRSWIEENKTVLADEQFGFLSWMWRLFFVSDSDMLDECGMDALCYTRVLEFGLKLSIFGMLNAFWLMPVYKTAPSSPETNYITDPVVELTVSNVPSGSLRFVGTVVAAYLIFGYTMYNILEEFKWFILHRHMFLGKTLARNYSGKFST